MRASRDERCGEQSGGFHELLRPDQIDSGITTLQISGRSPVSHLQWHERRVDPPFSRLLAGTDRTAEHHTERRPDRYAEDDAHSVAVFAHEAHGGERHGTAEVT